MAAQLRVLRRRIRSTQSTKKITRAMELIATSRIVKAQRAGGRVHARTPSEITGGARPARDAADARPPAARRAGERRSGRRSWWSPATAAWPVAYNANVLKEAEELGALLRERGQGAGALRHRPQGRGLLPVPPPRGRGRRGPGSPSSRRTRTPRRSPTLVAASWPAARRGRRASGADAEKVGVDEIHLVYTGSDRWSPRRPGAADGADPGGSSTGRVGEETEATQPAGGARARSYEFEPTPTRCSTRCCPSTSEPGCSPRC